MASLTAPIVKSSNILATTYLIFLKIVIKYHIQTSVKRSKKQLPSKTDFGTCLQVNCYNFRLKVCERP